jgi:hypothetical protein
MISLVTSLVGAGPEGGVTFGSFESGPLVGVLMLAAAVSSGASGVLASAVPLISASFVGLVLVADTDRAARAARAAAGDQDRGAEWREGGEERMRGSRKFRSRAGTNELK